MTIAPGLLDQRIRFYTRGQGGADGFDRPVYVFSLERWGRLDATADQETVPLAPQAHREHRQAATCFVADYVDVPKTGVLRVSGSDDVYYIRGVVPVRQLRLQRITAEFVDPTAAATFTLFEDADVTDGLHLVDPSDA